MRKILNLLLLSCLALTLGGSGAQKLKVKDLPEKYKAFIEMTNYIMTDTEEDVFLQLHNDRERDAFIVNFWRQRDPTPGTPQNEYQEEHIRRFDYANKTFFRGAGRPGWMTDMGKFYIILGEPASKERFYGSLGLYPCEVWYYYGDKSKGLPAHFGLIFYQRGNVGEYKLYDPVSDGPSALMIMGRHFPVDAYEEMYEEIQKLAPTLALVSLSIIPGDIPYNYTPSPQTTIQLADIIQSPLQDVNVNYATNFLSYKALVETEYMQNFIECETHLALIEDPMTGLDFLHFSMVPQSVSIDYFEQNDQYFCNYTMTVSLRVDEEIIFQYTREFPFYFSEENLDRIRANGIAIEDSIPVIEGQFKLIILLQNSVGKEFSIFEQIITVPEDSGQPRLSEPILGYSIQTYGQNIHIPFKIMDKKIVVDPKRNYGANEDISIFVNIPHVNQALWDTGKVRIAVNGLKPNDPTVKTTDLPLNSFPFRRILSVFHTLPGPDYPPDYYQLTVTLVDGEGTPLDEKMTEFVVSPQAAVAHPIAHSKGVPLDRGFLYHFMLASQYDKAGMLEKAETAYQKASEINPDYRRGLIDYAHFMFRINKHWKSLELAERIKNDEQHKFDYYLIRGKALMGMGRYDEAIANLLEGNAVYNSDTDLLNSLGYCYSTTGETEKALTALKASLSLNPDQPAVKSMVEGLEKK